MVFRSKRARQWFDRISSSRHMFWVLGTVSFLETIIIPVPIEVVLIPLMAANKHRIWIFATVALGGCLLASLLGYGVGMVLFQSIGAWFIETMDMQNAYEGFHLFFNEYGFIAILTLGILPIPFQIAMITAGLSGYPIHLFVLATVVSRGIRYYGLAWLVCRFGNRVEGMWQRNALKTSLIGGAIVLVFSLSMRALAELVM